MLLAGLTGGIGAGKSTVAAGLVARGAALVDADAVAREVVRPDGPAYTPVVARFGSGVLRPDGTLDRPALAAVVFSDPAALADLNAITHPVIASVLRSRVAALGTERDVVVLDVPLLDAGRVRAYRLGALVVVDAPEEAALARLVSQRGFEEADARARIAAQISRAERRRLLELVPVGVLIDNAGSRASLERQIDEAWQLLRRAARS